MSVIRTLRDQWRVFAVGWMLVALPVLVLDFFLRIYVPRDESLRAFSKPSVAQIEKASSSEQLRQRLQQLFPPPATTAVQERVMTLQAVFAVGQAKSAFIAAAAADGQVERIRAPVGHVIDGWVVESVESRKVVLKRGEERRELVMFGSQAK